jgi:hypothetical protein
MVTRTRRRGRKDGEEKNAKAQRRKDAGKTGEEKNAKAQRRKDAKKTGESKSKRTFSRCLCTCIQSAILGAILCQSPFLFSSLRLCAFAFFSWSSLRLCVSFFFFFFFLAFLSDGHEKKSAESRHGRVG